MRMLQTILRYSYLCCIALFLCACTGKGPKVESIVLDPPSARVEIGNSVALTVTLLPSSVGTDAVAWSSSSREVATVTQKGIVRALAEGTTVVTASLDGVSASCEVTVVREPVPVAGVFLDKAVLNIFEGGSGELKATFTPKDATDTVFVWESSDPSVASVAEGVVSGIGEGSAVVTVSCGSVSASCKVRVYGASTLNPIPFADEGVRSCLVAKFDADRDGELSYFEASQVTTLEHVFGDGWNFVSFDEFEFFTGVTSIPEKLFFDWSLLESIKIPSSVSSIGYRAFWNCGSLKSLVIPDSVLGVVSEAFYGCTSLESIVLSKSMDRLESGIFHDCSSLRDIFIPDSVKQIGEEVFWGCTSLKEIKLPASLQSIGRMAFYECKRLESIDIPDSVTGIGDGAFNRCLGLSSVKLSNSLSRLGEAVFRQCSSIRSIVIPDKVVMIGDDAFFECGAMKSLELGHSVESIGNFAFCGCYNLSQVVFPESLKTIGNSAFGNCHSLSHIEFPESLTSIGDRAFSCCDGLMEPIRIPDSVSRIGASAFWACDKVPSINIPDGVTVIEESTFRDMYSLVSIDIPDSVTKIGAFAFSGTSLTSITVPDSVTSIGEYAFYYCVPLRSIVFGSSVESFGQRILGGSDDLESITIRAVNPPAANEAFCETNDCPIYVPAGSVDAYLSDPSWADCRSRIQAIPSTE